MKARFVKIDGLQITILEVGDNMIKQAKVVKLYHKNSDKLNRTFDLNHKCGSFLAHFSEKIFIIIYRCILIEERYGT